MKLLFLLLALLVVILPLASLYMGITTWLGKQRRKTKHYFSILIISTFLSWKVFDLSFGSSAGFAPPRQENDYTFLILAIVLLGSCALWIWFIKIFKRPSHHQ